MQDIPRNLSSGGRMAATRVLATDHQAADQASPAKATADVIAPSIRTAENQRNAKLAKGTGRTPRSVSSVASRVLSALFENEID